MTKTTYTPEDKKAVLSALGNSLSGLYFYDFHDLSQTRHLDNTQLSLILRDSVYEGRVIRETERLDSRPIRDRYILTQVFIPHAEKTEETILREARKQVTWTGESTCSMPFKYHPDSFSVDLAFGSAVRHGFKIKKYSRHDYLEAERELKILKDALIGMTVENSRDREKGHYDRFILNVKFETIRIPEAARPLYTRRISSQMQGLARKTQILGGYASTIFLANGGRADEARRTVDMLSQFYLPRPVDVPANQMRMIDQMVQNFFTKELSTKSLRNLKAPINLEWLKLMDYIQYLDYRIGELASLQLSQISPE